MLHNSSKLASFLLDILEVFVIGFAVFVIVYAFIGQPLEITGDSMEPNLHDKEQIVAEKISSNFKKYQRGDIIVFRSPENPSIYLIKRIIGLPGDSIQIIDQRIWINGTQIEEPYISNHTTEPFGVLDIGETYLIGEDEYFVFGDNRDNSTDSRKWGAVKKDMIVGKAIFVFFPIENIRLIQSGKGIQSVGAEVKKFVDSELYEGKPVTFDNVMEFLTR